LDQNHTGEVSKAKLDALVKGFGPITVFLSNVMKLKNQPFFSILRDDAENRRLRGQALGTYIIRMSNTSFGLTVCYVKKENDGADPILERVRIIPSDMEGIYGWKTRGEDVLDLETVLQQIGVGEKYEDKESLNALIYFAFWVEGTEVAEQYLEGESNGTYFVRKSGGGNQFVLSVVEGGKGKHYPLEQSCGQVSTDEIRKIIDSINSIKEAKNINLKKELNAQEKRYRLSSKKKNKED